MKFLNKKSKGFTLLELLVVIAIIGILAGIVLVNVRAARNKAKDAAIKGNFASLAPAAEMFYDQGSTYDGFCIVAGGDAEKVTTAVGRLIPSGGANFCNDDADYWVACASLSSPVTSGASWCVDNQGNANEVSTCDAAITSCVVVVPTP